MMCFDLEEFSRAERVAIERHQRDLSAVRRQSIDSSEACAHWVQHCREQWRRQRHAQMLALQREEILRHKWIESEKRQRDIGAEAVFDWISRYAACWRQWFEENVV